MDRKRFEKMLSLGYCEKGDEKVGKYGNGFKSGSMRVGKDAMVFTQNGTTRSVGFLSQTFLEAINATEVLVPMCTWDMEWNIIGDQKQAEKGLNIMTNYSQWLTEEAIRAEFAAIPKTGTLIHIFSLSSLDDGTCEFQFLKNDIKLTERREADPLTPTISDAPYKYSLLAYCEVLYLVPRTQMYLQGQKVLTKLFTHTLCTTKSSLVKLKGYPHVTATFGFIPNPNMRAIDFGVYMYHRNRLIEPSTKVGMMIAGNSVGIGCFGCCEIPYLTPTHNKQGFMQNNLYIRVKRNLATAFNSYWRSCIPPGGITDFWKSVQVGVVDKQFHQCSKCRKWRPVENTFDRSAHADWECSENNIPGQSSCTDPELAELIHMGKGINKTPKRKRGEDDHVVIKEGKSLIGRDVSVSWSTPNGISVEAGVIINYQHETDEYQIRFKDRVVFGLSDTFTLLRQDTRDLSMDEEDSMEGLKEDKATPKRRGRPPKSASRASTPKKEEAPTPKRRGRPPKNPGTPKKGRKNGYEISGSEESDDEDEMSFHVQRQEALDQLFMQIKELQSITEKKRKVTDIDEFDSLKKAPRILRDMRASVDILLDK
eukprot:TRINITY_DN5965_c0_g1_i1.p1 TRINITY_DN5965_c0_g1~~TRINITY_DN5965_c0_g1_i1.p1  ORF type:complete len:663 (-),score=162.19 TRINITY_DN5965_c0_g1_i1:95-1876(-)